MRPYLAIIYDSFHAALASRVLWAALIAITLLLTSLAPIGLREDYTTTFRWFDVYNGTRMKAMLARGMVDPDAEKQPIGRLARAMPDELRRKLRRVGEGAEVRILLSLLTDGLNDMIESDAQIDQSELEADQRWYDAEAWKSTVRLRELRELDETPAEELSESLRKRRARLRIEAALPGVFESRGNRSVLLTYAGLDFPTGFSVDRPQFEIIFNQIVVPTLVHWLLGFVLVFLGVLVTASMIPDMLQAGSLHLLLSKPVSRSAVLISKFIGGLAFVFLCVSLLVLGLFLIAGLRLDIWNPRILWCIPVALVLFAVFFSVSVPAGLKWRSPIISIAAAGALAAICVVVGVVGGVVDARVVEPDRIRGMSMAGEDLFVVTGGSGLNRWDEQQGAWQSVIDSEAMSRDRILDPVALDENLVLTARIRGGRFNPFGSGSLDLIVLPRSEEWKPQRSLRLPNATEQLARVSADAVTASNAGDLLLTTRNQILENLKEQGVEPPTDSDSDDQSPKQPAVTGDDGDSQADDAESDTSSRPRSEPNQSLGGWLKALTTLQGGANEDFVSILPREVTLGPETKIAYLDRPLSIVIASRDRLFRLSPDQAGELDAPWQITARSSFERSEELRSAILAVSQDWGVVTTDKQELTIFDAATLQTEAVWQFPDEFRPLQIVALPDNRFVCLATMGDVLTASVSKTGTDPATIQATSLEIQRVEAIDYHRPSQSLLLAHDIDQVTRWEMDGASLGAARTYQSPRSTWRTIDHYVMGGLEWITPQVMQLGETAAAMVSGEDSIILNRGQSGDDEVVRYRIAEPLINCGVFIAVMLLLSCWYFARSDY